MKTIYILLLTLATIGMYSCSNEKNKEKEQQTGTNDQTPEKENQPKDEGLSLNDGKKWDANPETTEGIHNMIELADNFSAKEDVNAYSLLSDSIQAEFQTIFKKCTMKGEAHNQLHHYLLPLKAQIKKLSSDDLGECQSAYNDLNKHLKVYEDYFK